MSHRYPELQVIKESISASSCILDGEIVVLKKGLPSSHDLQKREIDNSFEITILSKQIPAVYVVFDIMALFRMNQVNPLLQLFIPHDNRYFSDGFDLNRKFFIYQQQLQ